MDVPTGSKVTISLNDLRKHNTSTDCWIAIHSKVWDITDFIEEHPGGPESECFCPQKLYCCSDIICQSFLNMLGLMPRDSMMACMPRILLRSFRMTS
jgi:hypothetical protein